MHAGNLVTTYNSRRVIQLVCITWFITKLLCYKLWLADRLFPLVPVNDLLSAPSLLHNVLLISSLGLMLLLLFLPQKKFAVILLVIEIVSCLLDQNRWQPWEYQFLFMLASYIFIKDEKGILFSWQLIIAGIFFFSGISKLNSSFIHDIWQGLILHRWIRISTGNIWLVRLGYSLPLIEMLAGIGLLISKTRRISVWVLVGMHLLILLMLGPAGLNINSVIWPWNILMPLLLFMLFYKTVFEFTYSFGRKVFIYLTIVCWWILPWFQLAGYWDKYLSSVLYSGGVEQLYICTEDVNAKKEMAHYFDKQFRIVPCSPVLSVYKWGIAEMNTAPYPEPRVNKAIIAAWGKKYRNNNDRFYLYKPGFAPGVKEIKYIP